MHTSSQSERVDSLLEQFRKHYGNLQGVNLSLAPGRVNLLGDHTDYNDGFVLPMTIDHAVYWALRQREDERVRLYSSNFEQKISYPLAQRPTVPASDWSSYVTGVIEELRQQNLVTTGFEGIIYGDVPLGGGLSSSAALEVATVVALQNLLNFELESVEAVKLCQRVEHRYVGVQCGIMDQFASRLGKENHALFLDCRTLAYEDIPLALGDVCVVIVNTGLKRALAASKYNERRAECQQGVEHFRRYVPVTALRDVSLELFQQHQHELPANVRQRCQHVIIENQRVLEAKDLLRQGRLEDFGSLMNASHASLRDLYQVSCPELDALVEIGQDTEGVLGARMTGAGFGGCTVHLAQKTAVPALQERIQRLYPARFNLQPDFYVLAHNLEAGPLSRD